MIKVLLPQSLIVLFPGCPGDLTMAATTVHRVIEHLNDRWPGMRSRLLDAGPKLREHILVSIDGELVGLADSVAPGAVVRITPSITGG